MATLTNVPTQPIQPTVQAVANPAPLGLAAFALTTFILSMANAGLIPKAAESVFLGAALAYGGVTQLCAGMWEFRRNNTFAATAFSSYGGFWISLALLVWFFLPKDPSANPAGVGIFLLAWSIFTLYMTYEARKHAKPVYITFLLLAPTFFLLAFGALFHATVLTTIGGYLGILTAVAAWYASYDALSKSR